MSLCTIFLNSSTPISFTNRSLISLRLELRRLEAAARPFFLPSRLVSCVQVASERFTGQRTVVSSG